MTECTISHYDNASCCWFEVLSNSSLTTFTKWKHFIPGQKSQLPIYEHCIEFRAWLRSIKNAIYYCEWVRHFQSYLTCISQFANVQFLGRPKVMPLTWIVSSKVQAAIIEIHFNHRLVHICILRYIFNNQGRMEKILQFAKFWP